MGEFLSREDGRGFILRGEGVRDKYFFIVIGGVKGGEV